MPKAAAVAPDLRFTVARSWAMPIAHFLSHTKRMGSFQSAAACQALKKLTVLQVPSPEEGGVDGIAAGIPEANRAVSGCEGGLREPPESLADEGHTRPADGLA